MIEGRDPKKITAAEIMMAKVLGYGRDAAG
jgi:hypothetical protein